MPDAVTLDSPLVAVLSGENSNIVSIAPTGDDVGNAKRSDSDEQDAANDLDYAPETDGEEGEEGGDEKPPARAVDHDALTNNGIALS